MKRITKLNLATVAIAAWRNSLKRFAAICFVIGLSSAALFAVPSVQYCHTLITAGDGTTVYLTCKLVSTGNYEIKIESSVAMSGLSAGCYCNTSSGGKQLITLPGYVLAADGKTITIDIPSTSGPNLYTPLYILMPGEKNFAWPNNVDWTATCSGGSTDATPPVMVSAAVVGTPTYNSANLTLSATDNVTSPVTSFLANDATNGVANKMITADASGNATVTGLNPATSYNLVITAMDAASNISTNSKTVSFTTAARSSDCSGDKGHFGNPTVQKIHYTIAYTGGNVIYTFTPTDAARTIDFAQVQTTSGSYNMTISTDLKSATYTQTGLTVGANLGVLFMYSFDNLPGNEMTAQTTALSDVNIIYYKVGDCALVDTQAPTAFTATKGTVTSSSVELLLNATDNLGVIVYTVSYGAGPIVVTQNGVSGTQKSFVVSGLTPTTDYTFSVIAKDAAGNPASNNPLTVTATTTAGLTTAAPTPTKAVNKVVSIFSDTYTSIAGTTDFRPDWGQTTAVSNVQIAGNTTMKYSTFNYEGTNLGSDLNLTTLGMTHIHFDAWTEDESVLRLSLIQRTPQSEQGVVVNPVKGSWNSFDIPISSYTSQSLAVSAIYQLKLQGTGNYPATNSTTTTVYLDNIYFYNDLGTSLSAIAIANGINCYPNPMTDKLTVSAKSEISQIVVHNLVGQSVKSILVNATERTIHINDISAGNYFVTVKLTNGQTTTQKLVKL